MKILVTGGAGYIGSVLAEELIKEGHRIIVFDNLQQGHLQAISAGAEFVLVDICDRNALDNAFQKLDIEAVVHMAAETIVEYSMTDPRRHFQTNVVGGINILEAMHKYQVDKIVFSSSASVYGVPQRVPIDENHPGEPINAYGESKLMFERILEWFARAYKIKYIALRYFNAAGASLLLGEDHNPETHLIPNVLKAALRPGATVPIYGLDHDTKDGSCIRDYLHVIDIARAHSLALSSIESVNRRAYNLGNDIGYSNLEVVNLAREITDVDIPTKAAPRRIGDPPVLIADSKLIRRELGWQPRYADLGSIINSTWQWMKKHPYGYDNNQTR
jgi:UDP-glucose 4-epimerase